MNLSYHHGTITGDTSAQVGAFCNLLDDRMDTDLAIGTIAPLDAPEWLNTSRMVNVNSDGYDVQFQQHTLRGYA